MVEAAVECLPTLSHLVGDIVCIGPKEKVIWIYAYTIVAMVQNMHTIRYSATECNP